MTILKLVVALCFVVLSSNALASGIGLPGVENHARSTLDPRFSEDVDAVMKELRRQGHRPILAASYRDSARQDFIFRLGKFLEVLGARPMTNARGGQSCHNHQDAVGAAASLAADIVPGPTVTEAVDKAAFFHALGKAAAIRGLRWGGSWPRRNPTWRKYKLGWDPGHVQSARCRW